MYPVLLESPAAAASPALARPAGPDYDGLLKDSIDRFLTGIQTNSCDFSVFRSIFFRLLQSRVDPPLEVIWFYSSVSYHESLSSEKGVLDRVLAVRDLMQLLVTCSICCSGSKGVALVAPVVSELCSLMAEVDKSSKKLSGKEMNKFWKEVDFLVEGVLSYISICNAKMSETGEGSSGLLPCFVNLVRVWTVGRKDGKSDLQMFFPLATDNICSGFGGEKRSVDYLAGVVTAEVFLLRLYLKFHIGGSAKSTELQNELRSWAVGSITGFGNCSFFEILLRLLLDSTLPFIPMLNSKDETVLRFILYDAVLLVDYSFLRPTGMEEFYESLKRVALTRLIVAHEAVQFSRRNGDQSKAISYINACSTSSLLSELVKQIVNQTDVGKLSRPIATTPQALLKWLLSLEEQGLAVFERDILKFGRELCFDESNLGCEDQIFNAGCMNTNDDLFFVDNKGEIADDGSEDHEMEPDDSAFVSAARSMKSEGNIRRKRKGQREKEGVTRVKFVKYKLHDDSTKDYFSAPKKDSMNSDSEVVNPLSDEEMKETEE